MNQPFTHERAYTSRYASVMQRLGAYTIDCILLFGGLLVWQAALYVINPIVAIISRGQQPTGAQLHGWVFATATIPFLSYFAATQSSSHQATFGMRWFKLKVATTQGTRISYKRAVVRCAIMLIPFELNHAVLFYLLPRDGSPPPPASTLAYAGVWIVIAAYLAAISLTRHRQSVHDLVAGTVVERTR